MAQTRIDMSDWIIHFVHQRNLANEPVIYDDQGDGITIPRHADIGKAKRFDLWEIKDEEMPLELDASALSVLLRILDDGHIRAGWSMRNERATIYGPRPACCFTEMPLYALLHYARSRSDGEAVDVYGIALRKQELFHAGARPVIYGISREYKATGEKWPRCLDPSCGIAEDEQYRFVSMKLDGDRPIDWTHEREWRWADVQDRCDSPGLPVWLDDDVIRFSEAVVIVRTREDAELILDKLKHMRDAGADEYDRPYLSSAINGTRVLAVDDALDTVDHRTAITLRLDDLPTHELQKVVIPEPDAELIERVRVALDEAKEASETASREWRETRGGGDVFGFAHLMVAEPRSPVVQAMLKLGRAQSWGDGGYRVTDIDRGQTGLLGEAEAAVEAAKAVLKSHFSDIGWYMRTRWD